MAFSVAFRTDSTHKVARKRDPPGTLASGRGALLRIHGGNPPDRSGCMAARQKKSPETGVENVERETGLEPATFSLGS